MQLQLYRFILCYARTRYGLSRAKQLAIDTLHNKTTDSLPNPWIVLSVLCAKYAWIKQTRSCFVLRLLQFEFMQRQLQVAIQLRVYIAIIKLNSHAFTGLIANMLTLEIFKIIRWQRTYQLYYDCANVLECMELHASQLARSYIASYTNYNYKYVS